MVQSAIPVAGRATTIVATKLHAGRCDEFAAVREIGVYRRMQEMAAMSACAVRGRDHSRWDNKAEKRWI
jgi:hypothetical protein